MAPPTLSNDEILTALSNQVWEDMGKPEEEAPSPTADGLRRWMPPFDIALALPFFYTQDGLMLETGVIPDKAPEPDDWQQKVWYRLKRLIAQHARDFPAQFSEGQTPRVAFANDKSQTTKSNHRLFSFDTFYDPAELVNADEIKPRTIAQLATIAVLDGWASKQGVEITSLEDGFVAIYNLWDLITKLHPGEFDFPFEPLIRQWLIEQNTKSITKESDQKRPVAVLKHPLGNVREIAPSSSNWNEGLGQLKGISALPPSTKQIEMPGIESPDSVLPDTLPLQAVHMHDGMDTARRGAVAMPIRLFFEAIMALDPKETRADILIRLGDLLDYLNPDGKYHRTNHLPHVLKGLHNLYYLRIPYRENPDKPSTEVDWIPVLPRTVPNIRSKNDAPVILEVKLPPDAQSGRMVEKDILRLLSKHSAAKTSAYLTACGLFDKYGTVKGKLIDPTRPVERRNGEGYLVKPDRTPILTANGKRIKSLYHPQAVSQLDREPSQARERYPILSFDDLIRACFPNGYPKGQRAKYLTRAQKAWTELEAEGIIQIERCGDDGWRIMPSEAHIGLHRGIRQDRSMGEVY